MIICHVPVSQNLSLIPYCKSNSSHVFLEYSLVCIISHSFYLYGEMVLKSQRSPLSKPVRKAYELYFGCKVGDEGKVLGLRICCGLCSRTLAGDG